MTNPLDRQALIRHYSNFLLELGIFREDAIVTAGGACLLHGLRQQTADIDLLVSDAAFANLITHPAASPVYEVGGQLTCNWGKYISASTQMFDFSCGMVATVVIGGVTCMDVASLLLQKRLLGRAKDQDDIRLLEGVLRDAGLQPA